MPEMELRWTPQAERDVWLQIFAYMGWPQNAARRRAQVASYLAGGLGALDKLRAKWRSEGRGTEVLEVVDAVGGAWSSAFQEFGGFSALEPLLSTSVVSPEPFPLGELITVGRVLLTVRSISVHHRELHGGGSIEKAAALIECAHGHHGLIIRNEKGIKEAWRKYRNISHLAASWLLIENAKVVHDLEGLYIFLVIAKDFEEFATSFRPHSRKEFLVDQREIWSVPRTLPLFNPRIPVVPPLHEDDLAVLTHRP